MCLCIYCFCSCLNNLLVTFVELTKTFKLLVQSIMKFLYFILFCFFAFCDVSANNDVRTIHVMVALCDNVHQGIAPVQANLGNGQDTRQNLYWGALYGVKTTFKRSSDWRLVQSFQCAENYILERCIFKHRRKNIYLIADAYDGEYIDQTIQDYMDACAGLSKKEMEIDGQLVGFGGMADLLVYIGHNGLMEHELDYVPKKADADKREAITLGCFSKDFFHDHMREAGAYPLLWTTGLMAPEAYILDNALKGWVNRESYEEIQKRAAGAYSQYQKCSFGAASRLIVSGW